MAQDRPEGKNHTVLGVLAHVDAGKTTLSEAMLYRAGAIRRLGRVDHRDSFLDGHSLERQRGITIFSKQAVLELDRCQVTLLDTPGHADLAGEAERVLPVLDQAVLVLSASSPLQAHTHTLWQLLERYALPGYIFVTKMDLPNEGRQALMGQLKNKLSPACVDFCQDRGELMQELALCNEQAMEDYLSQGELDESQISRLIGERKVFPCFFGSGLRLEGVDALLSAIDAYAPLRPLGGELAAQVFKIARDERGQRLSYVKVMSGRISVRQSLSYKDGQGRVIEEKVSQIRIVSGDKYTQAEALEAGQVGALLGLSQCRAGQGLGSQTDAVPPALEPVMSYRLLPPRDADPVELYKKLKLLEQEEPLLALGWNERKREISLRLMGKIQAQVFTALVKERFDMDIGLDKGRIMYKETIEDKVEGVGHFEPLRHYAEVHLLLEPLPPGSGIQVQSLVPEDKLDRNWQRLILSHILEKTHLGVLTGSPITDIRISLAAGRAHEKHTEGGDFRQAVYRAVRQGLMQARSVLLEPWYDIRLELPSELIGRGISDLRAMNGSFGSPEGEGEVLSIEGSVPVAAMEERYDQIAAYVRGRGSLSLSPGGYRPCRDQKAVVAEIGYDPLSDLDEPSGSVFCSHGAGMEVPWDRVKDYMHLDSVLTQEKAPAPVRPRYGFDIDQQELERIMEREFGPIKRRQYSAPRINSAGEAKAKAPAKDNYLIVDGYNLIFAWEELRALAEERLDLARERLAELLVNYSAYTGTQVALVFDGFRTPGNPGSRQERQGIGVAYTKDGETADAYIEKLADQMGPSYQVRVVTSDGLIGISALRSGVLRCSAKTFIGELENVMESLRQAVERSAQAPHTTRIKDGQGR